MGVEEVARQTAEVISNKALLRQYSLILSGLFTILMFIIKFWLNANRDAFKKVAYKTDALVTRFTSLEVSLAKEYATKREVEKIRDEGIESTTKVHERVDVISEKIAGIEMAQKMCPARLK